MKNYFITSLIVQYLLVAALSMVDAEWAKATYWIGAAIVTLAVLLM